jgi:hypothetical protein
MNPTIPHTKTLVQLMAAAMITIAQPRPAQAATPLQARIVPRPLTPGDVTAYQLAPGTEFSGGLSTVGLGQPVYLEAWVNSAIPTSEILGVTWAVTNQPIGSTAVLTNSPLGSNVPIYEPADRLVSQVAGRIVLRPDTRGQYTVTATITTAKNGATNVSQTISAGTYMGINTCALCHSGGLGADDMVTSWSQTAHSTCFSECIDGTHPNQSSILYHTVGYDTNALVANGGFSDVTKKLGWTFPAVLTNGNWAATPPALQNLANIQCENCHGAGSEHAYSLGNPDRISVSFNSGTCGQCHDNLPNDSKNAEWNNSRHAVTTRVASGPGREACVGCHTGSGFVDRIKGASTTNTDYVAINCQTCHSTHNDATTYTNLLRTLDPVALMDGTVVATGGKGTLCMNCHMSRQNATNYVETATGSAYFGPHEGPQADMLMGVNGVTYGRSIPSSAHRNVVADTCVTCHMQPVTATDAAFLQAGGHTFLPMWDNDPNSVSLTAACQNCHGSTISDTFDFPLQDYNGDGVIEGVQTEVQHLLDQLALLLPPVGQPKDDITIDSTWTRQQLRAAYNYRFVQKDGSHGIHNTAYAVGLLKASIADLTGDANNDGLPDAWQIQYFGSITNPNAAPNAAPAGDGIPNWLKYSLGIDPTVPGAALTNGVIWANVTAIAGGTNTIHIYTAAEVSFDTAVGKTYQIQGVSSLSGGWRNIGGPIQGTGAAISYLTPARQNVQQFFRVVSTP